MKTNEHNAPVIAPSQPSRRQYQPLLWLGALATIGGAGLVWNSLGLPQPGCLFRALTGLPCPFCGGVRSLCALVMLHPVQAFLLNPLFCLAAVGAALGVIGQFIKIGGGKIYSSAASQWAALPRKNLILVGLILCNWAYLLIASAAGFWP